MLLISPGAGWLFGEDPDGTVHITVMSTDISRPHGEALITTSVVIENEIWIRLLAALTGKTIETAAEFWYRVRPK